MRCSRPQGKTSWSRRDEAFSGNPRSVKRSKADLARIRAASSTYVFFLVVASLNVVVVLLPESVRADTLFVGGTGPGNYTKIQSAIDAASSGDTIYVYSGVYLEHLTVNKSLSLIGENRTSTIVDGSRSGTLVNITAANVTVEDFTFRNGGTLAGDVAARLFRADNCTIIRNNVTQTRTGIDIYLSNRTLIADNNVSGGRGVGIFVAHSENTTVFDNLVSFNNGDSVRIENSVHTTIANNTLTKNNGDGVRVDGTNNWTVIANNTASDNRYGVALYDSPGNLVSGNTLFGNWEGVYLSNADNNTIAGNTAFSNSWDGLRVVASEDNTVSGNHLHSNTNHGLSISYSGNTTVADNNASSNYKHGIFIYSSNSTEVDNNTLEWNVVGVYAWLSNETTIVNNTVVSNSQCGLLLSYSNHSAINRNNVSLSPQSGIYLTYSDNNTIANNTVGNNRLYGVYAAYSAANSVTENRISGNVYGIRLWISSGNRIHHNNILNNTNQAVDNGFNEWDDGYPSGGNYWSDYGGKDGSHGPGQNLSGGDAIGDTPYIVPVWTSRDRYPLVYEIAPPPWRPSRPQNLTADRGNGQVALAWSPPATDGGSPVVSYLLYRGTEPGKEEFLLDVGSNLSHVDIGLTNGGNYCYKVTAKNGIGEGPQSNEPCAVPANVPGPPIPSEAIPGDAQISLSWLPPLDSGGLPILNYTVCRGTTSGGEAFLTKVEPLLSYLDTGLVNGRTYFYTIAAVNALGEGPNSTELNATPRSIPSAPLDLNAVAGDHEITLTWSPSATDGGSPIRNYTIYRGAVSGGENVLLELGNVTAYVDGGLVNSQTYFYRVNAKNDLGEGPKSDEANATPVSTKAETIHVGGSGPGNHTTIQGAIDDADPGDTIYVHAGTYREYVVVYKMLSLVGENRDTTAVDGGWKAYIIDVASDWVNVSGLTITNGSSGIRLTGVRHCTVEHAVVSGNLYGVIVRDSRDVTVGNSTIADNRYGIQASSSGTAAISQNVFSGNYEGISLEYSDNVTVLGNVFTSNSRFGVFIHSSQDIRVIVNDVSGSDVGAYLSSSNETRLLGNNFTGNGNGINVFSSSQDEILNNTISGNSAYGLYFSFAANNTVAGNRIAQNQYGIRLWLSSNNSVYHDNFIDNGLQAVDNGINTWDDGYPSGGNYWSDYGGMDDYGGAGQSQPGGDGIGDTPYYIAGPQDRDRYPFMYELTPPPWRPSAPRYLTATPGDGEVTLTWSRPVSDGGSAITNYTVYRSTQPGKEVPLVTLGVVLTHADTGLTNGVTYYYKVTAVNLVGEGPKSNEASAKPVTAPSKPLNLTARAGKRLVTLSWEAPASNGGSPVTNYSVHRGTTPGGETRLVDLGRVFSYTDSGVLNGQTYYYRVSASNDVGEGSQSDEANAMPIDIPGASTGLTAVAGNQQVALSWSPPADDGGSPIMNYTIFRGMSPGSEQFLIRIGNTTAYTDTGLQNGKKYYYKVSATNVAGEGPRSEEANATPVTVPSQPLNLKATASVREVRLTWTAPSSNGGSPVTGYAIYRGTSPSGEAYLKDLGNVLTYTDGGLADGQTYFFQVSARNAVGEGFRSNEASASTPRVPGPPVGLTATAGSKRVTLTWLPPTDEGGSDVTNFTIHRGTTAGGEAYLVTVGNVHSYVDLGLSAGVRYYYRVAAVSAVGEGELSAEASAVPFNLPPSCVIWTPANNATVRETLVVAGKCIDEDGTVQKVEIRIDAQDWFEPDGIAPWRYDWDTSAVQNGPHTISVRCYDGENYSEVVSVSITVDNPLTNPPPEPSVLELTWLWALVVFAVVLVFFFYVRRVRERRK